MPVAILDAADEFTVFFFAKFPPLAGLTDREASSMTSLLQFLRKHNDSLFVPMGPPTGCRRRSPYFYVMTAIRSVKIV